MKSKFLNLAIILILLVPFVYANTNLEVDIPQEYSSIHSGTKIVFTTKLLSLQDLGRRDVTLKYEIINDKNVVVLTKSETVAVQTQASFVGNIQIPENLESGIYSLKITLISDSEQNPETIASFSIVKEKTQDNTKNYIYIGIIALTIIIILLLILKSKIWIKHIKLKMKIKRIVKQKLYSNK